VIQNAIQKHLLMHTETPPPQYGWFCVSGELCEN